MKKLPTNIDQLIMELEMEAIESLMVFWAGGSGSHATEAHEALRLRCDLTGESYPEIYEAAHVEAKRLVKVNA